MAANLEEPLRAKVCVSESCGDVFYLCRSCDRGQRYCGEACRSLSRQEQRRRANRKHQGTPEGRLDHRDHQRTYRRRLQERVTDPSSETAPRAGSLCEVAARAEVESIGPASSTCFVFPRGVDAVVGKADG